LGDAKDICPLTDLCQLFQGFASTTSSGRKLRGNWQNQACKPGKQLLKQSRDVAEVEKQI